MRNFSIIDDAADTGSAQDNEMAAKQSAKDFMEKAKEESFIDEITSYD